jgi:hypothetical protein
MPELEEILYCSLLAADQPTHVVGRIVTRARSRNASAGITGLLVFDGMRFCEHIEGPAEPLRALWARLQADPRHTDLRVLHQGSVAARRYQRFEMGLAEVEFEDDLAGIAQLQGDEALHRFIALRPRFDIGG